MLPRQNLEFKSNIGALKFREYMRPTDVLPQFHFNQRLTPHTAVFASDHSASTKLVLREYKSNNVVIGVRDISVYKNVSPT
jgi:hypothetical protein